MSNYLGIKYFIHNGSTYVCPHYTNASNLAIMLNLARETAYRDMVESGAGHAVYGVKHYDPGTGCLILALHAKGKA